MEAIDQILYSLYHRVIEPKEAKEQLLALYNVAEQCEPLNCGHKHVELVRHAAKCKDCGTVFETKW